MAQDHELAAEVRKLSGIHEGHPDNAHIVAGIRGFIEAFDYWYIRVIQKAVPQYRNLIIKRINPFIRSMEFVGMSADQTAGRLVEDYNSRNFVTAGGWALEEMAVGVSVDSQKSSAEGIDIQRFDVNTSDYHLYVLKSGLVTRNSDIIKSLKRNARQAEKLLLQGRATGRVLANYAIAAGKTSSTFEDGIRRPSSAEFWSEMIDLPEDDALELVLAMAAAAGRRVRIDARSHIEALKLLITVYIGIPDRPDEVDWEFLAKRNMRHPSVWRAEDQQRHACALADLTASGYTPNDDIIPQEELLKLERGREDPGHVDFPG